MLTVLYDDNRIGRPAAFRKRTKAAQCQIVLV
jgi:hypothetical protein